MDTTRITYVTNWKAHQPQSLGEKQIDWLAWWFVSRCGESSKFGGSAALGVRKIVSTSSCSHFQLRRKKTELVGNWRPFFNSCTVCSSSHLAAENGQSSWSHWSSGSCHNRGRLHSKVGYSFTLRKPGTKIPCHANCRARMQETFP